MPPDLAVFSGLPGAGNSTVARAPTIRMIAAGRPALWLRIDTIDRALAEHVLALAPAETAG